MGGRDHVLAAFGAEGARGIGAVSCYDGIFIRDHFFQLTEVPWWYHGSGIVEHETAWIRDVLKRTGLEWIHAGLCPPRKERERIRFEVRGEEVHRFDPVTREDRKLDPPTVSGVNTQSARDRQSDLDRLPETTEQIDARMPPQPAFDGDAARATGRHDLAQAIRREFGVFTYTWNMSPLSRLYGLLGYEGMMVLIGTRPDLCAHACRTGLEYSRNLARQAAAAGVDGVWIEELFTDQIGRRAFLELNLPPLRALIEEIRALGLKSIYYYCGDPGDRLDLILSAGADALSFEEGKKGFVIDIASLAEAVDGRCVLFGNLDSVAVLQDGTEERLRAEVERQIAAGHRNRSRFVMSTGSPITPGTPVSRVKLYTDLVREAGR